MNHRNTVLRLFSLYCAATGRSTARVSTLVWNHGARHRQILGGADLRTRSFERALRWFSEHWPAERAWPRDVARPGSERPADADTTPGGACGKALGEAMKLNENGRLRSPTALCRTLRIGRATYTYVVRRYADGGDRAAAVPQRDTWTRRLLDHLVESGDVRFAERRARLKKAAEVARRLELDPARRSDGRKSDAV